VEFCPFLPNLFATLLGFFSEAETMLIVSRMLQEVVDDAHNPNPKLLLRLEVMNKQAKLFIREGRKRQNVEEAFKHLEHLDVDLHAAAVFLLHDGLAHTLPFRALCRVVGSTLVEGNGAILRYGMALVKLRTPDILKCRSKEEAEAMLRSLGSSLANEPHAIDGLTKVAYALSLGKTNMARVSCAWGSSFAAPKMDGGRHMFCRPRLFDPRGNCPDELWEVIWPWVPSNYRIFDPRMIYTPGRDGTSLRTCLELCKKYEESPMIFFVYSKSGDIIGGFSPHIWVRTSGYLKMSDLKRGADDAFVFRKLQGKAGAHGEVFAWTGANEMLFSGSEVDGLVFGGDSAAISLNRDLTRAQTAASATFNSPILIEPGEEELTRAGSSPSARCHIDFELVRFEIFALL